MSRHAHSSSFIFVFSLLILGLSLLLGIGMDRAWFQTADQHLSKSSTEKLRALNLDYDASIELIGDTSTRLSASLLSTNSFFGSTQETDQQLLVQLSPQLNPDISFARIQVHHEDADLDEIADAYEGAIPEFLSVEEDQKLELEGEPVYYWANFDLENPIELSSPVGREVTVAVIDSGLDQSHELFRGRLAQTLRNLVDDSPEDFVGHGTHIAGIIVQKSQHARIAPYKVYGESGGRISNVVQAVKQAIEDDVDVINTSFGVKKPSSALEKMLELTHENDVLWVSAAGNHNNSLGFYPASFLDCIAVAAIKPDGEKLAQSNYGSWIDFASNGYLVRSSLPGNEYGLKSGSSQSTALVSARLADYLATQENNSIELAEAALHESGENIEEGPLKGATRID